MIDYDIIRFYFSAFFVGISLGIPLFGALWLIGYFVDNLKLLFKN